MLSTFFSISKKRIYLDYASITPIDPRVSKIMSKIAKKYPANPSSLYKEGVAASGMLENARGRIASALEAHADEVVFTSGGTESNNLAVRGVLDMALDGARGNGDIGMSSGLELPHIITTSIEHPSIRELVARMEKEGKCTVTTIPVSESGVIDARDIKKALRKETVLVSVMHVNNEIGTIQPINEVVKAVRAFKKENGRSASDFPYVHTDACQAALYCPMRIPSLGVDMMTLDGSKMYGPRGAGILYVRRGLRLTPQTIGGDQEHERRAGTEDVSRAQGLAYALELCRKEMPREYLRIEKCRNELLASIMKAIPAVRINGEMKNRVPSNINICLPGMDAEFAVLKLDVRGVCVSSVTSCRSKKEDASSYVIEAMERGTGATGGMGQIEGMGEPHCAKSSLRITLGRFTSEKDIKKASTLIISVLTSML